MLHDFRSTSPDFKRSNILSHVGENESVDQ